MTHPSEIPRSISGLPFPYGDIARPNVEKANTWLEMCENIESDRSEKISQILTDINHLTGTEYATGTTTGRAMYRKAIDLCNVWDVREHNGKRFAWLGFIAAHGLAMQSRIFPPAIANFSTELQNMKDEQTTNVRSFGEAAWHSMKAYPQLLMVNTRLNAMLTDLHVIPSRDDVELQKAGIGLSSTLGFHSALARDMPRVRYKGVKDDIESDANILNGKPIDYWLER